MCCSSNQLDSPGGLTSPPPALAASTTSLATSSTTVGLQRSWDRLSLRGRPGAPAPAALGRGCPPSRARLQRARSMDKADAERFRAMQLSGERVVGSRHNVCTDCRDLLTSIVRAQRHAAKLEGMKRRLGGGLGQLAET